MMLHHSNPTPRAVSISFTFGRMGNVLLLHRGVHDHLREVQKARPSRIAACRLACNSAITFSFSRRCRQRGIDKRSSGRPGGKTPRHRSRGHRGGNEAPSHFLVGKVVHVFKVVNPGHQLHRQSRMAAVLPCKRR